MTYLPEGHRKGNDRSPTYGSWRMMNERCYRVNKPRFEQWGGRGITVCPQWRGRGGFNQFLADMGERPEGMTLDRIDPEGNYEPGNVRWADAKTQAANKRKRLDKSSATV